MQGNVESRECCEQPIEALNLEVKEEEKKEEKVK